MEGATRERAERRGWVSAPCLVAAYAGGEAGVADLGPALRVLARRPEASVLLWPEGVAPPEGRDVLTYALPDGADDAAGRIAAHAPWGVVVLAEPGWTPFEVAHLCYLAGVERRAGLAGLAGEFGGAVLSDPVPEPAHAPGPERHLALLAALGLDRPLAHPGAAQRPTARPEAAR